MIEERRGRGVMWDFVHKLSRNPRELEILGNGRQSKEYLYVEDCVEGMIVGYHKASDAVDIINLGIYGQTIVDRVADLAVEEMELGNVTRRYTGSMYGDRPVVELELGNDQTNNQMGARA